MKVLVTGNLGYIGTVLTPMLVERGHEVVGIFDNVTVQTKAFPSKKLVYKAYKGPFSTIPKCQEEIAEMLNSTYLKKHVKHSCGIYFDNPNEVSQSDLRWWIGFIIDSKITDKEIDEVLKPHKQSGLRYISIPANTAM